MVNIRTIELCEKFCNIIAPSGYEELLSQSIAHILKELKYEIITDSCGNLICTKKSNISHKKIAFLAHMDTASIVINGIDPLKNKFYWGSLSKWKSYKIDNQSITFLSGSTAIACIANDTDKCNYIQSVNGFIEVGDVAVLTPFFHISDNVITATYLDDRVGCAILVDIACRLNASTEADISFIFTVQEEIGNKGAYKIAQHYDFDEVYCIDTTRAISGEYNQPIYPLMGEGTCIKLCDGTGICSKKLNNKLISIAESNKIHIQKELLFSGGSDISAFARHGYKTLFTGISIPCKNMHSRKEQVCISDIIATEKLILEILRYEKCKFIKL